MKTKRKIVILLLSALILLNLTGCALYKVKTQEEVIKDAGQYAKCTLVHVEKKEDCLGKTDWTVYTFQDASMGFKFEYVTYLSHYVIFGKQIGFGVPTHACNWSAMRDKYLSELYKDQPKLK